MTGASEDLLQAVYGLRKAAEGQFTGNAYYQVTSEINELIELLGWGDGSVPVGQSAVHGFATMLDEVRTLAKTGTSGSLYSTITYKLDALAAYLTSATSAPAPVSEKPAVVAAPAPAAAPEPVAEPAPAVAEAPVPVAAPQPRRTCEGACQRFPRTGSLVASGSRFAQGRRGGVHGQHLLSGFERNQRLDRASGLGRWRRRAGPGSGLWLRDHACRGSQARGSAAPRPTKHHMIANKLDVLASYMTPAASAPAPVSEKPAVVEPAPAAAPVAVAEPTPAAPAPVAPVEPAPAAAPAPVAVAEPALAVAKAPTPAAVPYPIPTFAPAPSEPKPSFADLAAASKARVEQVATSLDIAPAHHVAPAPREAQAAPEPEVLEKRSSEPCSMPEIAPVAAELVAAAPEVAAPPADYVHDGAGEAAKCPFHAVFADTAEAPAAEPAAEALAASAPAEHAHDGAGEAAKCPFHAMFDDAAEAPAAAPARDVPAPVAGPSFDELAAASKAQVEQVAASLGVAAAHHPAPSQAEAVEDPGERRLESRSSEDASASIGVR